MSWSVVAQAEVTNGQVKWKPGTEQLQTGHGESECKKSIAAARGAVEAILGAGVLGDGEFNISINGHSNPGNTKAAGFVNDSLNLNISQL